MAAEGIHVLIHKACKACGLTKKAVEYYLEQGLISPAVLENGYRDFSEPDVERMRKIATLRGLGLSVSDMQRVLESQDCEALSKASRKMDRAISDMREKHDILEKLSRDHDWQSAHERLQTLEMKRPILQRLMDKFPGYYGKYLSLHFAAFLDEPIAAEDQQEAFDAIVSYLDEVHFEIPDDLREVLDEAVKSVSGPAMSGISKNLSAAVRDTEQYLADNQDAFEQYIEFMRSDEYKQSPAYRLKELLIHFNKQSGYYDIFIPAMKKLSRSYREYHDDLLKADALFARRYGDVLNDYGANTAK